MSRLDIPSHPDRVFKDDWWDGYESASGYRATGDRWAFAVVDDSETGETERRLIDDILSLRTPFDAAEVVKLADGTRCVIGFHAEPSD